MAEPATEHRQQADELPSVDVRADSIPKRGLVTPNELHEASPSSQRFGGYSRDEVQELFERAAATISELSAELNTLRAKLERPRIVESAPEEVVARMLATASRIVDSTKEEAEREAAELVAQARNEAEGVAQLHREALAELDAIRAEADGILAQARGEAEGMVAAARAEGEGITAAARVEAEALTSAARAERQQLIASSTRDAEEARTALEQANARIESAIEEMRSTWTNRIKDALARLDSLEPAPKQASAAPEQATVAPVQAAAAPVQASTAPEQTRTAPEQHARHPRATRASPRATRARSCGTRADTRAIPGQHHSARGPGREGQRPRRRAPRSGRRRIREPVPSAGRKSGRSGRRIEPGHTRAVSTDYGPAGLTAIADRRSHEGRIRNFVRLLCPLRPALLEPCCVAGYRSG